MNQNDEVTNFAKLALLEDYCERGRLRRAGDFKAVKEEKAKIGDIVVYSLSLNNLVSKAKSMVKDGVFKTEKQAVYQAYFDFNDLNGSEKPGHFSLVILKDKTGEKIQSVLEKPGEKNVQLDNAFQEKKEDNGKNMYIPSGKTVEKKTPIIKDKTESK